MHLWFISYFNFDQIEYSTLLALAYSSSIYLEKIAYDNLFPYSYLPYSLELLCIASLVRWTYLLEELMSKVLQEVLI